MTNTKSTKPIPEGPKGGFLSGCADEFKNHPLEFMEKLQAEHGNICTFNFGPFPLVFLNEPDLIHEVLVSKSNIFTKDVGLRNNREFFGQGLLSSEGELWKRQRKLAAPTFSPKSIEGYGQVMVDHGQKLIDQWQDGQTYNIQHEMMILTLGIAMKTLFDADLDEDHKALEEALTSAQHYLTERMNDPIVLMFPEWVPFPTNVHLLEAIRFVDDYIYKLIKERRGNTNGRTDLLSKFLEIQDEDGSPMSDKQIRDEVFTLFFAGHETTALTLTWTLYQIAQHPDVEERLLKEFNDLLADGKKLSARDYYSLPYTEKVVKETMRMLPPVWGIGREASEACEVGGYEIPKGMAVLMSQWVMHKDKRFYKDPHVFNPDRWTKEFEENLPKMAYFPFGGGPRVCIGNGFAMLEAALLLVQIVKNFHLEVVDRNVELLPAVTLRPKNGINMRLKRR